MRLLVGDMPQRARYDADGDGDTVEFDLPEHPIIASRVVVDGLVLALTTDYTLDEQFGVLTFVEPPAPDTKIVVTYTYAQFTDAQLEEFLTIENGDARLAAADALDSIATNAALLQGKMQMLDVTLDGTAVAKILHDQAKALRDLVASGQIVTPTTEDEDPGFAWAEMVFPTNAGEKLRNEVLRGGH
jgi:hypothetical protein